MGQFHRAQPSSDGQRWVDLDTDESDEGYIAANIMLQICDGRPDCDFICEEPPSRGTPRSWMEFFKRDLDKTAYIHLTRCTDGVTANTVTAPLSLGSYKKCLNTFDSPTAISSFKLPPFLCEQSCDKDPTCTMFTVDKAGANCWLSKHSSNMGINLYIKMPDGARSI